MGPPSGRDFQISTPAPGFQKLRVTPGLWPDPGGRCAHAETRAHLFVIRAQAEPRATRHPARARRHALFRAVTSVTGANCLPLHSAGGDGDREPQCQQRNSVSTRLSTWIGRRQLAKSDRERKTLEQMAEAWLEAAALWDEGRTGSPNERTLDEQASRASPAG
jgi:hypothetical protein